MLFMISFQEPGPIGGGPLCSLKVAPAARSALEAGRPSAPPSPGDASAFRGAPMTQGGPPDASSAPIMLPALVPTTYSALAGSQPVSRAIASRPPVSEGPSINTPLPRPRPTLKD